MSFRLSGNPIETKWVRQNNQSLPYSAQAYGSTLYIENVQPSDAGEYLCLGQDRYGTVHFTVTVNLVVLGKSFRKSEILRQN